MIAIYNTLLQIRSVKKIDEKVILIFVENKKVEINIKFQLFSDDFRNNDFT